MALMVIVVLLFLLHCIVTTGAVAVEIWVVGEGGWG